MIKNDEILTSFEKGLLTDRTICTDAIASKYGKQLCFLNMIIRKIEN